MREGRAQNGIKQESMMTRTRTRYLRSEGQLASKVADEGPADSFYPPDHLGAGNDATSVPIISYSNNNSDQNHHYEPRPRPSPDAVSWSRSTRADVLVAEALVVAILLFAFIFSCYRANKRALTSPQARLRNLGITMAQLEAWTTIQVNTRSNSQIQLVGERGPTRQESGLLSLSISVDGELVLAEEGSPRPPRTSTMTRQSAAENRRSRDDEAAAPTERTLAQTISQLPRSLLNVLLAPLRALEAGINDWAQESTDETFLRDFVERLEREREEALEDPKERELRVKQAFRDLCLVYKLSEEDFLPPIDELMPIDKVIPDCGDTSDTSEHIVDEKSIKEPAANVIDDCPVASLADGSDGQVDEGPEKENDSPDMNETQQSSEGTEANKMIPSQGIDDYWYERAVTPLEDEDYAPGYIESNSPSLGDIQPSTLFEDELGDSGTPSIERSTPRKSFTGENYNVIVDSPEDATEQSTLFAVEDITTRISQSSLDSAPGYLYISSGRGAGSSISVSSHSQKSLVSMSTTTSPIEYVSQRIPSSCAICLCDYEANDVIVTSHNPECPHAFHQECIVEWLGKMQDGTPCPCCRREFVKLDGTNDANSHPPAEDMESSDQSRPPRAFDASTIRLRSSSNGQNNAPQSSQEVEVAEQERRSRRRHLIEEGLRRGGRAFNTSVIRIR
mmetsp:Transcript_37333/g.85285  ORF Transcript_37333/g.85285 Transcript_37333/m.85285 type:complete len:678 (+) Transcript_37333:183-2216(+)